MPAIAVIAAIGADVLAGVGVAGVVAGEAAFTAVTAFEVIGAVGATLGAIGAITKDKTLSMVGLGLGAVGGIGALATSAGLFGADAASGALFGSGPQAAAATQSVAGTFGGDFIPQISAPGSAAASGGVEAGAWDVANAASDGTINWAAGATSPTGTNEVPPTDQQTFATTSENISDPARKLAINAKPDSFIDSGTWDPVKTAQASVTPDEGVTTGGPGGGFTGKLEAGEIPAGSPTGASISSIDKAVSDKGIFGGLLDFANKNPTVAMGVLKAGGSLLEGATNQLTPAQIDYYNAKAAEAQANAAMSNQQRNNLAAPKAVASVVPVTGAPQPLVPQIPGLINQPPPRLAPVTGAVA